MLLGPCRTSDPDPHHAEDGRESVRTAGHETYGAPRSPAKRYAPFPWGSRGLRSNLSDDFTSCHHSLEWAATPRSALSGTPVSLLDRTRRFQAYKGKLNFVSTRVIFFLLLSPYLGASKDKRFSECAAHMSCTPRMVLLAPISENVGCSSSEMPQQTCVRSPATWIYEDWGELTIEYGPLAHYCDSKRNKKDR